MLFGRRASLLSEGPHQEHHAPVNEDQDERCSSQAAKAWLAKRVPQSSTSHLAAFVGVEHFNSPSTHWSGGGLGAYWDPEWLGTSPPLLLLRLSVSSPATTRLQWLAWTHMALSATLTCLRHEEHLERALPPAGFPTLSLEVLDQDVVS